MIKEKIAVFGRGTYYTKKIRYLQQMFEIVAFIDNNASVPFPGIDGSIPVICPHNLEIIENKRIFIMTSQKSAFDIAKQLLELGIDENRIDFGININPPFDALERGMRMVNGEVHVRNGVYVLDMCGMCSGFSDVDELRNIIRKIMQAKDPFISIIDQMGTKPLSTKFGRDIGEPIDRYYIENFLENNKEFIQGNIIEVGDNYYTKRYGHDIEKSIVIHVNGGTALKVNLETGEGVVDCIADCFICTQTIQMIFDIKSAMKNIYRLLNPGGYALITIHGISQISTFDYSEWGEYWRVTAITAMKLALDAGFCEDDIQIDSFGNAKTAICFLMGVCQELLNNQDFLYNDDQYPIIITMKCKKKRNN